jgi:hypothetical protein
MTSTPDDGTEPDHPGQATESEVARWRQPVSLALLVAGLGALLATRVLGSLEGGPFNSVADVGPRPLWAVSLVLLLLSGAVAAYRR